jgi:hypothetical protein
MDDAKHLFELINPSDRITFRATLIEAACIADEVAPNLYFVKDSEGGDPRRAVDDLQAQYDAIWRDAGKIASYAAALDSFLVGSPGERELFEEAVRRMTPEEAAAYRASYHDKRCTSLNDICQWFWEAGVRVAAATPDAEG